MGNDAAAGGSDYSVLVVDDEAVTRLLLGRLFTKVGLMSVVVASAAEALSVLGRRRFDLLLTDKNLGPTENGVDLAAAARKIDPDIAVVLMTGFASAESAEALFKLGVDGYVTKPFELPALLERIQQVRDVRRLSVKTLTVKPQHVLVSERDPLFRESLRVALTSLGCELHAPASLLESLRATPAPDAVVAEVPQIDTPVRRELFLLRARRPTLRIGVVGEANSLEDTLTAIGVAAHQRISRKLDPPGLLAVLSALLR